MFLEISTEVRLDDLLYSNYNTSLLQTLDQKSKLYKVKMNVWELRNRRDGTEGEAL